MDALWVLPTQKVTGVVELSTKTLRTFVSAGRRYSVNWPVVGFSRKMRSLYSPPDHALPFLSTVTSYGHAPGVGARHSWKRSVRVSNIPIRSARFSPNQRRSCESIMPRRGPEPGVGVLYLVMTPVFASILTISSLPRGRTYPLFRESGITSYTLGRGILYGSNISNFADGTSRPQAV